MFVLFVVCLLIVERRCDRCVLFGVCRYVFLCVAESLLLLVAVVACLSCSSMAR